MNQSTQLKKAEKAYRISRAGGTAKDLEIMDQIIDLEEKVDGVVAEVQEALKEIKPLTEGHNSIVEQITRNVLKDVKGETGEKGEAGEQGVPGEAGRDGKDGKNGRDGRDGKDGKDGKNGESGRDGKDGQNGKDGKNGSEDTGIQIIDKINSAPIEPQHLIKKEHVEGLTEDIEGLRASIAARHPVVGGPVRRKQRAYSLTSQCNGSTKDFTLPLKTMDVIGVFGTTFPVNYDAINDWSFAGHTLTLGASVPPPDTGQTLWALIETL